MGNLASTNAEIKSIIKKTYALINFENTFKEIHAKNLKISNEEIIKDVKEYRRLKRENKQNGV